MNLTQVLIDFFNQIYIVTEAKLKALLFAVNSQHIAFVFTSFLFALLAYLYRKKSFKKVYKNTFRYLRTKRFQKEFLKDLKYIPIRILTKALIVMTIGVSATALRSSIEGLTDRVIVFNWLRIPLDPYLGSIFQILIVVIVLDLGEFLSHLAGHKIENLWFFHKLHHRATTLNSLTKVRLHPIEEYWGGIIRLGVAAPLLYLFEKTYSISQVTHYIWFKLVIVGLIYYGLNHLRHSNVRIHYPKFLSYVLISPVMHQVHHSNNPKHFDKNFGVIFSFWDLILGTLYIPKKNEYFKYGLSECRNEIMGVWQEVFQPFVDLHNKYSNGKSLFLKNKKNPVKHYK